MEKILILGGSGLVGRALCNELKNEYKVYGTYNNRQDYIENVEMSKFQVEDSEKIKDILSNVEPKKIIMSLRGDFEKEFEVIKYVTEYSKKTNAKLYYISTWNVFDAHPNKIYHENDERLSDTEYGNFKIKAEDFLMNNIKDNCTILRLTMIWGKNSPRLNKLKDDLESNEPIEITTNLFLNNNSDEILAKQIKYVLNNYSSGIFHLGSSDEISQKEFVKAIVDRLGYKDVNFNETIYGDGKCICMLGISDRLPKELQVSNEDIINNILESEIEAIN